MKLPNCATSIGEKTQEFDAWITPSTHEIQDTKKYQAELAKTSSLFDSLAIATDSFADIDRCGAEEITETCINLVKSRLSDGDFGSHDRVHMGIDIIESLMSLLFMVTGGSDNNLKCQFPVHLAQKYGDIKVSQKAPSKNKVSFLKKSLGRTITSDKVAKVTAQIIAYSGTMENHRILDEEAKWLLKEYVTCILRNDEFVSQFWAFGKSYCSLKGDNRGLEKSLLAPIVAFKVRGSVSASGGHIPEDILRKTMSLWGLGSGVDFNLDDVTLGENEPSDISKTRAYDFILPYNTVGWQPHLFIQSQFYAGDSGSVSHKVVDQTQASRRLTLKKHPHARFIEYVDGAGYYSSLNTDLKHLLGMESTRDFIQIRSATIKLRRELQDIGFLTTLEIEHAAFRSNNRSISQIKTLLLEDDYSETEIERAIQDATNRQLINIDVNGSVTLAADRTVYARRIFLLDIAALTGNREQGETEPKIVVSGFGMCHGAPMNHISEKLDAYAPTLEYSRTDFVADIGWLIKEKLAILSQ